MDYPEERDAILETLDAIEEQLAAVQNKREEHKDQLRIISQAKQVRYPIANLYANVWTDRGRRAQESRSILSALGLNPELGLGMEPGLSVVADVEVEPFGRLTLHGTVNERGVMSVLDVEDERGDVMDRDMWMGRYHDYFALLLVIQQWLDEPGDNGYLHPHTPDHLDRPDLDTLLDRDVKTQGQSADLRWETEQVILDQALQVRYWTERVDRADGATYDDQVSVEVFDPYKEEWVLALEYNGTDTQFYRAWPLEGEWNGPLEYGGQ